MAKDQQGDRTYERLIDVGLKDPFIRGVAGPVVVVAVAASIAVSALGSGPKAVITLALSLAFGVVLIVLRTLMKYVDSPFVRVVCFGSSAVIMSVFLAFAVLLVPAAVICWPRPYAQLLSLPNCGSVLDEEERFEPIPFRGPAITLNPENQKYLILVFYRPERQEDARYVVGALLSAGYRSEASTSTLAEVVSPNRNPNTTLIKTTTIARPVVDDVARVVRIAVPVRASSVMLFPDDAPLQRGNIQIDLF